MATTTATATSTTTDSPSTVTVTAISPASPSNYYSVGNNGGGGHHGATIAFSVAIVIVALLLGACCVWGTRRKYMRRDADADAGPGMGVGVNTQNGDNGGVVAAPGEEAGPAVVQGGVVEYYTPVQMKTLAPRTGTGTAVQAVPGVVEYYRPLTEGGKRPVVTSAPVGEERESMGDAGRGIGGGSTLVELEGDSARSVAGPSGTREV